MSSDTAAFEDTLASVLQNRPAASEILVAHNGHYDDPFDLGDEVSFVSVDSSSTVDLIMAGAQRARAQFVHVLAPGFQAIEDWTVKALESFEHHDVAVIAPVIKNAIDQSVVAAGWSDSSFRLCQPSRKLTSQISGAYLQASFWRRGVLQSLAAAFSGGSINESSYAFGQLILNAGWRGMVAPDCEVTTQLQVTDWDQPSYRRGRQLRALREAIARVEMRMPLLTNLMGSLTSPQAIAETIGQANYRGRLAAVQAKLQVSSVVACRNSAVLSMHKPQQAVAAPRRRAA